MAATKTTKEIARELDVSPQTIWRWAREGRLPTVRIPGSRLVRFPENLIEDLQREADAGEDRGLK